MTVVYVFYDIYKVRKKLKMYSGMEGRILNICCKFLTRDMLPMKQYNASLKLYILIEMYANTFII